MKAFDFDNVQLVPKKCVIKSRSEADTQVTLGDHQFRIPVVPANMASVITPEIAAWLADHDYFYVMHRFEPDQRLAFVQEMHANHRYASISIGIKDQERAFIDELRAADAIPEYITIDVAHGHSDYVMEMIKYVKQQLPATFLIVGNVATPEAVRDLEAAGADATKVGVGPGRACITKLKTGFGTAGWQLAAIQACAAAATKPIIADGGIRTNGDIAKAVRFGATMVMVGSLFAGHIESPGEVVTVDGRKYKRYWGSASARQKGNRHHVEGKQLLVPFRGSLEATLTAMEEDLQSAISYAGGRDLGALRQVDYVIVPNTIYNGDHEGGSERC